MQKINSDGHTSIIGNTGYSSGVHEWFVYFDSLVNHHWVAIGVIEK